MPIALFWNTLCDIGERIYSLMSQIVSLFLPPTTSDHTLGFEFTLSQGFKSLGEEGRIAVLLFALGLNIGAKVAYLCWYFN